MGEDAEPVGDAPFGLSVVLLVVFHCDLLDGRAGRNIGFVCELILIPEHLLRLRTSQLINVRLKVSLPLLRSSPDPLPRPLGVSLNSPLLGEILIT